MLDHSSLSNGVQVLTSTLPGFRSAAVAAFVNTGSRNERPDNNGIAHFLEHMAFKGTSTRSARDIAQQIEVLGSSINAYTSANMTAYYATGLAKNFAPPLAIIGDVLTDSQFHPNDIAMESSVILQEINRTADDPDDVMFDLLKSVAYPAQAAGRPILGDPNFVANVQPEHLRDFVAQHYTGDTIIVVGAGGIEHQEFVDAANAAFANVPSSSRPNPEPATYHGGIAIDRSHDFRQVAVGIGFPSVTVFDAALYAHRLLAAAFGGGMSSPLFTEVRENRGLVYHTSCFGSMDVDSGMVSIVGGMTPENLAEFITVACGEFARLCDSINAIDLERAKNAALVRLAMLSEQPFTTAQYIAMHYFQRGRVPDITEMCANVESVTMDDIKAAAHRLLAGEPSIALVGPVPDEDYATLVKTALGRGV